MIRRERRWVQLGRVADVVMVKDESGQRCYGLTDPDGHPLPHSPPISELSPEALAAGERMRVLVIHERGGCTRLVQPQSLKFVRIGA